MKFTSLLIAFVLICSLVHGQIRFKKTYLGSCNVTTDFIQQCSDSGYVIGSTTCFGIYVIRTNSFGDTIWTNMYVDTTSGYSLYPTLNSIRQISDKGFMIAGKINGDGFFMRLDSMGNKLWVNHYDDETDELFNVVEQDSGGYIINGYSNGPMSHDNGFYINVNDSGHYNGYTSLGNTNTNILNFVGTLDNGIITAFNSQITKLSGNSGGFSSGAAGYPVVIVPSPDSGYVYANYLSIYKIDLHGNPIWSGNPGVGLIRDVVYINDNLSPGYAILSMDTIDDLKFHYDDDVNIHLSKTDTSGNLIWTRSFSGFYFGQSTNLVYTKDGGFAIVGITRSVAENTAIIFLKTDSAGNIQ